MFEACWKFRTQCAWWWL